MIASSNGTSPESRPLVLIANDQEWTARSLETILEADGCAVVRAYTGRQALERAAAERPDLVVLDRQLPDLDGPEVCRRLRQEGILGPHVPIVITTAGPAGRTQRLEAYEAGAWEFFGQPLDGELTSLQLRSFLAAKRQADLFRRDSLLDELTGLYTGTGLERRALEIGAEASRQRQPLACVVFAAHGEGLREAAALAESVARQIGSAVKTAGRSADAYGRLGALDFAVVAPSTTGEGARRLVERISQAAQAALGEGTPVELKAGYCAVSDYGAGEMDVREMLEQAWAAVGEVSSEQ
jgi:PleD family two-component response regulator